MKKQFALRCLAPLAALLLYGAAAVAGQASKPNIVLIVGDDMGYADIGVHGCQDIPTPHIDAIAAAGIRCTNGYVSGPYCSPTRAGLLTGRYQTRFGHEFNPGGDRKKRRGRNQNAQQRPQLQPSDDAKGLPLSETTVAERLREAGYVTGLVGKWHLGGDAKFHPQRRGFDEFFGFLGGAHGYFPDRGYPILQGTEPTDTDDYLTDAFGREAVAFVDAHARRPFFLYLAFNAVHTPMHADDARLEKFSHIEDPKRRTYAAMMSAMDDAIGSLLAELRKKELEDNTLVIFISDNGGPTMPTTSTNASSNKPLRGSKRTTLEGGIRVPFFVKWPARLPAGQVYHQPVIQLDIVPTALAAAGVTAPAGARLDGVDLLPYFRGEREDVPHKTLYWRFGDQMAIRQGDWKLVRYDPTVDGVRRGSTTPKLYNLAEDIGESNNRIDEKPQLAKSLQAAWDEWNHSNVPPRWGGRPSKRPRSAAQRPGARPTVAR